MESTTIGDVGRERKSVAGVLLQCWGQDKEWIRTEGGRDRGLHLASLFPFPKEL